MPARHGREHLRPARHGRQARPPVPDLRAGRLARNAARVPRATAPRERRQLVLRQPHCRPGRSDRIAGGRSGVRGGKDRRRAARESPVAGRVAPALPADVGRAMETAVNEGTRWSRTPAIERAACLLRAADQIETERATFIALAVREAGKTFGSAVSEVREAVDFLRYYGSQAREL